MTRHFLKISRSCSREKDQFLKSGWHAQTNGTGVAIAGTAFEGFRTVRHAQYIRTNLIDMHAAKLELYARQWCDDAGDVVQSAFVRLIEQQPDPERPVAWLFCVVRNEALMQSRAQRRRQQRERVIAETTTPWFESSLNLGLDTTAATEALQELSDECREVVIAHIWGTLTFEEIGELTGTSSSTAHRRYLEGLEFLRKQLGVSCPSE